MTTIFCNNSSDQLEETLGIFRAFQALQVSYTRASSSTYNSRLQGFIWSWKLLLVVFRFMTQCCNFIRSHMGNMISFPKKINQ